MGGEGPDAEAGVEVGACVRPPKLRISSRLPSLWPEENGLLLQADIGVNEGRLRAKLLLFDSIRDMRAFWKKRTGHDLGSRCRAAVNGLHRWCDNPSTGERWLDCDERYFCMMGFTRRHLTAEIIVHECVHAGFQFARRKARSWWDDEALHHDEEAIAYPAGIIANGVVRVLRSESYL